MRYLAAFLAALLLVVAAIPVAHGYVVNSDYVATIVGATTDGSLIYAFGADDQGGAIFVFDAFKLTTVYHLTDAAWIYDAQYYNGYLYVVGKNDVVAMINVGNWQVSRQVNVGYTPLAIEKIGDQFYVTGYKFNESTGRYDTYMSIFDLNLNLADEKVLYIYDYGGMVPLDIAWNGTHVAIVGYTKDAYTDKYYPVIAYWDPSTGNYTYTIFDNVVGYGTSVDVCDGYFVFAVGPKILFNDTFYDIGYNVTDVACLNGLIWFAYNEDGLVTGAANTIVHVGYINTSDGSITDVVAGYGRVYVYGDPVKYGDTVMFGGAAYCPECMGSYPSTAALFLMQPLTKVVEVRTTTVTTTVTTTTTVYYWEVETETETVTETATPAPTGWEVTDVILIAVVALLLTIAVYVLLTRRR